MVSGKSNTPREAFFSILFLIKHPEKHDLVALKEEVSKLEGRIAELEEGTEYFRVSQKKNELEERATALEKQLKKMQEEEWKVKEDILK